MENIIIKISVKELEDRIRQYYCSLDKSIIKINVKYSPEYIHGTWSDAWQYHMGSHIDMKVKVETTKKVQVFGEIKVLKREETLLEEDIKHILKLLLKKDNLKVKFVYDDIFDKDIIRITCERLVSDNKKSTANISNEGFLEYAKSLLKRKLFNRNL